MVARLRPEEDPPLDAGLSAEGKVRNDALQMSPCPLGCVCVCVCVCMSEWVWPSVLPIQGHTGAVKGI